MVSNQCIMLIAVLSTSVVFSREFSGFRVVGCRRHRTFKLSIDSKAVGPSNQSTYFDIRYFPLNRDPGIDCQVTEVFVFFVSVNKVSRNTFGGIANGALHTNRYTLTHTNKRFVVCCIYVEHRGCDLLRPVFTYIEIFPALTYYRFLNRFILLLGEFNPSINTFLV